MLELEEKELLIRLLLDQVALAGEPRALLMVPLMGTTVPAQLAGGTPHALVQETVRLCIANGWAGAPPPWLVRLIVGFQLHVLDARMQLLVERLKNPPPPPGANPLDFKLLNNSTPFVNREGLRLKLRALESPTAQARPILVLNGPSQIGKTYSANYIDHYSLVQATITPHRFVFDADLGLELKPELVALDLVQSLGKPDATPPPAHTNIKLYAQQLANWVLSEASDPTQQNWFILDNFRGDTLRADTREFLIALSDKITNGAFRKHCRLILIGFDRALLTVEAGKVDEEVIQPCSDSEIVLAVAEILQRAPVAIPVLQVSPVILGGLPPNPGRMAELNIRLRGLLYSIQEIASILASHPAANYDFLAILLAMLTGLPPGAAYQPALQQRLADLRQAADAPQNPPAGGGV
jgi:hypothetical protein